VPHRLRTLLVATVSLLGCAALELPASVAASTRRAPDARVSAAHKALPTHRRGARASCRSLAARRRTTTSRAAKSARGCRARTRVRSLHVVSPRRAVAPIAAVPSPPPGEAPAASTAAVLASSCQNTELTPEAGNLDLIRAATVCLVNKVRAQHGLSPLRLSGQLDQAADGHSQELIAADYFAHVSPDGETPVDRIRETGYIQNPSDGYVIGENLAWGTYSLSTPQSIVSAWVASPEHLANILESRYRETGVGVVAQVPDSVANGAPGATYAQEFGVILR
jgi:uncharacterized protein YkwD